MGGLRWFSVAFVVALFALTQVGGASAQPSSNFTLQPGGKAVVSFEAFCTEFGEVFPANIQAPNGSVAPDAARAAMSYGVSKGLNANEQQALQLQYAVWQALGAANSPKGDATAQDVLTNGKTAPANPQGTSVLDAAKANQVKVTINSWQPIGNKVAITPTATDNFYGRGQLTVENTSGQALTLYMPVGTVFPSVDAAQQTMAGYATNVQVSDPAPTQRLPATGGNETRTLWFVVACGLFGLGIAARMTRVLR